MAKYVITAYDAQGRRVHAETAKTVAVARKTAREFLPYCNVYTVEIARERVLYPVARYVKTDAHKGAMIVRGEVSSIRF